jgi:hypothetical protein
MLHPVNHRRHVALVLLPFALLVAACGSDHGDSGGHGAPDGEACENTGDTGGATANLSVALDEWAVTTGTDTITPGTVAVTAQNDGEHAHELLIVKGDALDALPKTGDEIVDVDALPPGALVGELEGIAAGASCTGVFDLEPGTYQLICNIYEEHDGQEENHLFMGMSTTLRVG